MYKLHGPDVNEFYNMDISMLKQVLGEKLHYHYATGNYDPANPFDQAIIDLYPYFKPGSRVLDCGCGWGGPARMLKEDLNCDVTGVTVSTYQAQHCQNFFKTITADFNHWHPTEYYDTAFFMESYVHMIPQALINIKDHVQNIVMKDTLTTTNEYDITQWYSKIRTKEMYYEEFDAAGFEIKEFKVEHDYLEPCTTYWYNNLLKFDIGQLPTQLRLLHDLCIMYRTNPSGLGHLGSITVYATRR